MECNVYIKNEIIGKVTFEIIDESMGGIGGKLEVNENYQKFKSTIQKQTEEEGNSNSENFEFRIFTKDIEIVAEGGISISDSAEFDEITIESAGINLSELSK